MFILLLVYIDEILVFSSSFEEHMSGLEKVFQRLLSVGLKLNPSKCNLCVDQVEFLGHTISAGGINVTEDKVKYVQRAPALKSQKELRSFMNRASYYRRFVPNLPLLQIFWHS